MSPENTTSTGRAKSEQDRLSYLVNLVDHISDALISTDLEFRVVEWNPAAADMYGWTAADVLGRPLPEFVQYEFPESSRKEMIELVQRQGVWKGEVWQNRRDGTRFPALISVSVVKDPAGRPIGFISIHREISEQKRVEKQLRQSEERFSSIFRSSPTGINIFRLSDGKSVDVNDAFLDIVGYTREEILSHSATELDLFIDAEARARWMKQLSAGDPVRNQDAQIRRKTGEVREVLAALDRIEIDGEQMVVVVATDITERKQYEQKLHELNAELEQRVTGRTRELYQMNADLERANRTKDEFLATMSHELRTPLNSILGMSEILLEERRGSLNDYQHKALETIQSSGYHLLELINDILDVSKIEAGKLELSPQSVSVDEVCRASLAFIKSQAARKSITIAYHNQSAVSRIFADELRLKQILVNLLTNAVKFTPDEGSVTLYVSTDMEQELIQFSVGDTGIGIAPEDLQRVFQPFVQVDSRLVREYEGTGLGLALVQRLTDLHGGSISVESEPGNGSRFTVNLSCRQENIQCPTPDLPDAEILEPSAMALDPRGRILLAEDNLPNTLMLVEYLESYGYSVAVAGDGLEALAKAEELQPRLILMDIQMPVLNGLEAILRLRADPCFAATPIIALTALAMPGDRERCLKAGADGYLSKPVSLNELVKTIERLLTTKG